MPDIDPSKTQIPTTKSTYKKYGEILKKLDIKDKVLDYSSGLGTGTKELSVNAKSFEPYADYNRIDKSAGRIPDYEDVNIMAKVEGTKSQKAVVNHMVLNVIDDIDERKNVVKNIATMLEDEGYHKWVGAMVSFYHLKNLVSNRVLHQQKQQDVL